MCLLEKELLMEVGKRVVRWQIRKLVSQNIRQTAPGYEPWIFELEAFSLQKVDTEH